MRDLFHRFDPITSERAAARHTASGRRAAHLSLVYGLVVAHPGSTAVELWESASDEQRAELVEMQEIRRRLTDLLARGWVRQGPPRPCRVRGSSQVTWTATDSGRALDVTAIAEGEA